MQGRHRHWRTSQARHLFLLLAIACGVGLLMLSHFAASAQSEPPPVHEIAFDRNGQIYVMKADGERQPRIIANTGQTASNPAWSYDASRIAFNNGGELKHIWTIDANGTEERQQVTSLDTDPDSIHNADAAYSPNGQQIAYSRLTFLDGIARIYLISSSGGVPTPLVTGLDESFEPVWSPDGTKIAFASGTPGNLNQDIYVVAVDGSAPAVRVTQDAAGSRAPVFSPDGQKIVYVKGGDIYVINIDGTGQTNLTNTPDLYEDNPTYSPDNARIAFAARTINGSPSIYIMDASGANVVPTNESGDSPAWKPIPGIQPVPTPTPTPFPEPTIEPTPELADLSVQLTASPVPVAVGQNLTYTLIVRNNGPSAAQNAEGFLIHPARTELVYASAAQGSCGPGADGLRTICQLGQIASGAQTSIQFVFRVTAGGEMIAYGGTSSQIIDNDTSNNTQQLVLVANDSCVPEVTSQVQQLILRPGNQSSRRVKHTIVVRNNSGRPLNGLVHFVFEGLPESVEDGDLRSYFFLTRCAQPLGRKYTTVGVGRRELVWLPGQYIQLEVDFFNPERLPIDYRLRIYTGPGYP